CRRVAVAQEPPLRRFGPGAEQCGEVGREQVIEVLRAGVDLGVEPATGSRQVFVIGGCGTKHGQWAGGGWGGSCGERDRDLVGPPADPVPVGFARSLAQYGGAGTELLAQERQVAWSLEVDAVPDVAVAEVDVPGNPACMPYLVPCGRPFG